MGKTFRRNQGRRPKWDKHGQKSKKQRDFEEEKFKYSTYPRPVQPEFPEPYEPQ